MAVAPVRTRPQSTNIGTDRLLFGIIFGLLAFWLFAQTMLNIGPVLAADLGITHSVMNIAVSITALFSGIFMVVVGGLADQFGRVKMIQIGFALSIIGLLMIAITPGGGLAETSMMSGRILHGLSGAFIMPVSLSLVKANWDGEDRQRAVSLWSMGTWGGAGLAAVFGGLVVGSLGWRWIFLGGAAQSGMERVLWCIIRNTGLTRSF